MQFSWTIRIITNEVKGYGDRVQPGQPRRIVRVTLAVELQPDSPWRAPPSPSSIGRTAVTVDLSIRLGEALALSPDFFSKAQLQYDLWIESQKKRQKIKPLAA